MNPLNTMWHCHGYEAPIGWGKNRRNRKGERRIGEKIMFSLIYFKRENTKNIKQRERGNPPMPANCFLPIWEENLEENRRKEGLTSWITHLPPQSWRPIRDPFLKNLFIYGKLCVRTFFSFLFFSSYPFFHVFLILFFCAHTFFSLVFLFLFIYLFFKFWILELLILFLFFREVIIQT